MLLAQIKSDIQTSLKEGNSLRVSTLRMTLSAIRNSAISKYGARGEEGLTDQDVLDVIKKQSKERKESIEAYKQAGRTDLVEKEQQELDILVQFLPKELTDEELKAILQPIIASGEKNFGLIMKQSVSLVQGKADGSRISAVVKQLLGNS